MVVSYLMAQMVPWTKDQKGFLLVLGTSNICESLRGYMTKYDCSSADINPIGGINKSDLKRMLIYLSSTLNLPVLAEIAGAKPTAELRPFIEDDVKSHQLDEVDMGMTYDELDEFGRLRKISKSGPVSMFERLLYQWPHLTPRQVAEKVKRFFYFYSVNRHKMTVLTPSYHAEAYGTDDNRFDLRQFLYDTTWEAQFAEIDKIVLDYERDLIEKASKPVT
jgi:NAD+ synthase (glutamine-hydrolysing)